MESVKTLLEYINDQKRQKLAQLRQSQEDKSQAVLQPLERQLDALKDKLESTRKSLWGQLVQQNTYDISRQYRFEGLEYRRGLLAKWWKEDTETYFAQMAHLRTWLQRVLDQFADQEGEIHAGESEPLLRQMFSQMGINHLKLKHDSKIIGPGFVFQHGSVRTDATLSAHLAQVFAGAQQQLNQMLVDDDDA